MKILVTAGGGGHTGYAVALGQELGSEENLVFLVDASDELSAQRLESLGVVDSVLKPRHPSTPGWMFALRFAFCLLESLGVWLKHRPLVVVSTGSNIAIPIALVGKVLGSKLVNIEDSVRIFSSSKTSRYLDLISDTTLLQWREQEKLHPRKGLYVGLLLRHVKPSSRDGPTLISPGTFGFRELYDAAIQTSLQNVVMTVGDLDPSQYRRDGWTIVGRLVGLDEVLSRARVVVTHLGYTAWESINYRVPVVIVPNPAWRRSSVREMETVCGFIESKGYGIYLHSEDLTPETLEKAVIRAESMKIPEIDPGAERAAAIIREVAR